MSPNPAGLRGDRTRAARFEAEERRRLGLDEKPVDTGTTRTRRCSRARARDDDDPARRPDARARPAGHRRARGTGLPAPGARLPGLEALRLGKEFGNRGQCNPTYFTVGNLMKHLIHLRDEEGCPSPDILRATSSSRPARAAPAGSGPTSRSTARRCATQASRVSASCSSSSRAASGRRRARRGPGDQPRLSSAALQAMMAGDCSTWRATASALTRSKAGETDARSRSAIELVRGDARRRGGSCGTARCRRRLDDRGGPPAAQAQGVDHRRVLGDDDRGRRQLPPAALPRGRGRRGGHSARRRVGPLQHLGASARHAAGLTCAARTGHGGTRGKDGRHEAGATLGRRKAVRGGLRALHPGDRPRGLPPAGHGPGGDDLAPGTTTTTCAAARGTWRSAS